MINVRFYGITSVQTYIYFQYRQRANEKLLLKGTVGSQAELSHTFSVLTYHQVLILWLVEPLHYVLSTHSTF